MIQYFERKCISRVIVSLVVGSWGCMAESKSTGSATAGTSSTTTTGTVTKGSSTGSATESTGTSGPGPAEYCWQYDTQADCDAQGSACEFAAGLRVFAEGTCTDDPEHGWCHPSDWGGSATSSAWYEPSSGRVKALSLIPFQVPSGWERCDGNALNGLCDPLPTIEACRVCLCDGVGTGTGTGTATGTATGG